ncbi:MAG: chorismate mutase [Firmicutes bacterium]|nr:chorismate mutase [Bacillota bacterium]
MEDIKVLRSRIDKIDDELIKLFENRLDIAKRIGDIKRKNNIKVVDLKREEEVIRKNVSMVKNKDYSDLAQCFFKNIIELSKKVQ